MHRDNALLFTSSEMMQQFSMKNVEQGVWTRPMTACSSPVHLSSLMKCNNSSLSGPDSRKAKTGLEADSAPNLPVAIVLGSNEGSGAVAVSQEASGRNHALVRTCGWSAFVTSTPAPTVERGRAAALAVGNNESRAQTRGLSQRHLTQLWQACKGAPASLPPRMQDEVHKCPAAGDRHGCRPPRQSQDTAIHLLEKVDLKTSHVGNPVHDRARPVERSQWSTNLKRRSEEEIKDIEGTKMHSYSEFVCKVNAPVAGTPHVDDCGQGDLVACMDVAKRTGPQVLSHEVDLLKEWSSIIHRMSARRR
jgi:hypothetical protein